MHFIKQRIPESRAIHIIGVEFCTVVCMTTSKTDYNNHKNFVPNVIDSGIISDNGVEKVMFEKGKSLTSPSSIELNKLLTKLNEKKITHVALEASSHGIYQHRIDYLNFKAVGFTNFSQDHLDYHKTLEEYFKAKLRIFSEVLESGKYAVLNTDIDEFDILNQTCKNRDIRVIEYGKKAKDLQILCSDDSEWEVKVFGKI